MRPLLSKNSLAAVVIGVLAVLALVLTVAIALVPKTRVVDRVAKSHDVFVGEFVAKDSTAFISRIGFDHDGDCAVCVDKRIVQIPGSDLTFHEGRVLLEHSIESGDSVLEFRAVATLDRSLNELTLDLSDSSFSFRRETDKAPDIYTHRAPANVRLEKVTLSPKATIALPNPGYEWQSQHALGYDVKWISGVVDNDRNIVSSSEEGKWTLLPGYAWDVHKSYGLWAPRLPHPTVSGLVAADQEGKWRPADGYTWKNSNENSLETVRATSSNNVASTSSHRIDKETEEFIQGAIIGASIGLGLLALDELFSGSDNSSSHQQQSGFWPESSPCSACDGSGFGYDFDAIGQRVPTSCSTCGGSGLIYH